MERAEKAVDAGTDPSIRFEILPFSQPRMGIENFTARSAEAYGEKLVSMAEKDEIWYRYRHKVAIVRTGKSKSASGQKKTPRWQCWKKGKAFHRR